MRLVKLTIALVVIHLGFGFTQMVVTYYAGDKTIYGTAGWVSHTPIGTFIDLEDAPPDRTTIQQVLGFVNKLSDAIYGLASFNYDFMADIQPDDGFVYIVVLAFRIMSALFLAALGVAFIYFLFDSNLLASKFGMVVVVSALGLGGLSAIKALLGGFFGIGSGAT